MLCFTKSKCLLRSNHTRPFLIDANSWSHSNLQHYQHTRFSPYHSTSISASKLTLLYRPLWSLSQPLILLGISVSSSVGHCPTLSQLVYPLDILGILQCILNTEMINYFVDICTARGESAAKTQNTSAVARGRRNFDDQTLISDSKTRHSVQ